jgi:hypothetical protein
MELTCNRCHQTVEEGASYCPACGLPQLVFIDDDSLPGQSEPAGAPVRDADSIDWRYALRLILSLAIPAGILCSLLSPLGILGWLLMAAAAAWAVALYRRGRRPAWITLGAGARIGLATGVVGGWSAASATALSLYAMRFWLHEGQAFDGFWQGLVNQQMAMQSSSMSADPQAAALLKSILLSPEGRSGSVLFATAFLVVILVLFAMAGGALGARFLARSHRPEI